MRRQWRRVGVFVNFEHISHRCSSVSIVNFEHAIAGWDLAPDVCLKNTLQVFRKPSFFRFHLV